MVFAASSLRTHFTTVCPPSQQIQTIARCCCSLLPRLAGWRRLIQIVGISWRLRTIINIIQMLLHLVVALNYPEVPITILIIAQVLSSYHESRNTIPTLNLERISSMMCNMGQDDVIVVTLHIRQHILKHFYIYIEDNSLKSDESECILFYWPWAEVWHYHSLTPYLWSMGAGGPYGHLQGGAAYAAASYYPHYPLSAGESSIVPPEPEHKGRFFTLEHIQKQFHVAIIR